MIDLSHLKGRRYGVFGLGRTGLAAIEALVAGGVRVAAWDDKAELRAKAEAAGAELRDFTAAPIGDLEGIVWSPGAPFLAPKPLPAAAAARRAGVPLMSDVQLLLDAAGGARVVGITGSNGKSTTTALIGHLLEAAGVPCAVGGNLGPPTLGLAPLGPDGVYVIELSSYQLELTPRPRFDVAVFLNLEPDHLDRHAGLHGYAAAKRRIFEGEGAAVVGVDDAHGRWLQARLEGRRRVLPITADADLPDDLGPALRGRHNRQNAAAALAALDALGVARDRVLPALKTFGGLPHRQELVRTMGHVAYVNDSKATNAPAATRALDSFPRIYWIAGGEAKDGGLAGVEPWLDRIQAAYLIGKAAPAFRAQLARMAPRLRTIEAGTLEAALRAAHVDAQADPSPSAVLLSPACASFDQFQSYEARGDIFRRLVKGLAPPQPQGAAA